MYVDITHPFSNYIFACVCVCGGVGGWVGGGGGGWGDWIGVCGGGGGVGLGVVVVAERHISSSTHKANEKDIPHIFSIIFICITEMVYCYCNISTISSHEPVRRKAIFWSKDTVFCLAWLA